MIYTSESANAHRTIAQGRIEFYYSELDRQEKTINLFMKVSASTTDPEQRKEAESKIRAAGLYMTQLRDSYIQRTREAIHELDAEIAGFKQQQSAPAAKGES